MENCFVISPIGSEGAKERKHADDVFEFIIKPAMEQCQIKAFRSDHLDKPGRISEQMFKHLYSSDLCIALLTGYNPNVFYELALAQAAQRPVIILLEKGNSLPFDISDLRCVYYDLEIRTFVNETYIKKVVNFINEFKQVDWSPDDSFRNFRGPVIKYLNMDADVPKAFERSAGLAKDFIREAVLTWMVEDNQSLRDTYRNNRDQRVREGTATLHQLVMVHHKQHFQEILSMLARFKDNDRYELKSYEPALTPVPTISLWSFDNKDVYLGSFHLGSKPGGERMLHIQDTDLSNWLDGYWHTLWHGSTKLKEGLKLYDEALEQIRNRLNISDDEYKEMKKNVDSAAETGKWKNGQLVV